MSGADAGANEVVAWGVAASALDPGGATGDLHVVAPFSGGALVAAIDGLGHGPEAALAARAAGETLAAHAAEPIAELVARCHEALRGTRGAVLTLASLDAAAGRITWLGVGNVDAILLRASGPPPRREALATRGGIVGYRLPPLRVRELPLRRGDTLVLATDGIRSEYATALAVEADPGALAAGTLARFARGSDDALVLVARYLGPGEAGARREG